MKACPKCGTESSDEAKFCIVCGTELGSAALSKEPQAKSDETENEPPVSETKDELTAETKTERPSEPLPSTATVPEHPPAAEPLPVLVENRMPFTKQTLRDYFKPLKTAGIVLTVVGAIILLLGLVALFPRSADRESARDICVCGLILAVCGIVYLFLYSNVYIKKNKIVTDTTHLIYQLDDMRLHQYSFDGEEKIDETHVSYEKITAVRRNKRFYILRIGGGIILMERGTFTYGSEDQFEALIRAKCPPKTVRFK